MLSFRPQPRRRTNAVQTQHPHRGVRTVDRGRSPHIRGARTRRFHHHEQIRYSGGSCSRCSQSQDEQPRYAGHPLLCTEHDVCICAHHRHRVISKKERRSLMNKNKNFAMHILTTAGRVLSNVGEAIYYSNDYMRR